ncbi:AEC family transporter [Sporosarcina sp. ANT_H38]|uniref:AEC family transporter n=1 Tax=Sporosarcina sp. ANT_H38 TaxID=2597358 RepID=UPI0011F21F45|nr:AEC family transporter [Sporosarcina sp. ANT_H38]KAA0964888.1 AEC family transporter [Sporosarcina sp. ANT_H38]
MNLLLIILPVFIIFSIGYIGQKFIGFDIKSISTAALYLMSPFLAFRTFYTNELTMDYFYIVLFSLLLTIGLLIVVWITALIMKATRPQLSAMILGGVFMNSGNYGAPVVLFAFGAVGFDYAVIMMVFQSLLMNTVGIFFASIGGEEKSTLRQSAQRVIRMPLIYAAFLGIGLQLVSLPIPSTVMEAISLVADASIPTVMLVLGMQLAAISRKRVAYRYVSAVSIIRMIASPLIAVGILYFMPVNDLLKAVIIVQASMPAAANTTMLALQFGTEPDLVSFTTFFTTLISIITIPVILFFLGV